MGNSKAAACVLALVLCGLLAADTAAAAAGCDASALSPCVGAIMLGGAVTPGCCARLRAQRACLCQYARDPSYRGYVNSPRAQSVVAACGLPRPKC
ncbi:probable non-specific lipid-transfer protein 2 [Triticum urartu]|uniref:probable non-specific lipid-transfer protein 2 n=1 Tax=Triticum urartu TaxID=4572 RepID=UPI0020435A0F|nr:probable non-specific lipid-transfer protein 2 [Triticum urartu]XP_048552915.1 probable non-specific lipid-transfer protein 2 [Triticum urartu]